MDIQKNTTLDDIAAVIGFSATLRLSAWFGNGNNLYVPDTVEDGQVLVRLLGRSAAERLTQAFGREHLAVPRLASYEEDVRRKRIGSLLEGGFSTRQVSQFERISERRVQQICRELEVAGLITPVGPAKQKTSAPLEKAPSASLQENWHAKPGRKKPQGKTRGKSR